MPRFRDPKICWNCNPKKDVDLYEAINKDKKYVISDEKARKKFTLLVKGTGAEKYMEKCTKCIFARPIETETPLWWVICYKCNCKTISPNRDVCMKCVGE